MNLSEYKKKHWRSLSFWGKVKNVWHELCLHFNKEQRELERKLKSHKKDNA